MRMAQTPAWAEYPLSIIRFRTRRLSAAAINLLKIIPAPSLPGVQNNYVASGFGVYNFNQADTRIDYQLKPTVHIFGRYGYLGSNQASPASLGAVGGNGFGVGGWAGNETGGNDSLAVGTDLVVSPKLVTDIRFSYFRYAFVEAKYDGTTPLMTNLGWAGLNTGAPGSGGASQIETGDDAGKVGEIAYLGSGNQWRKPLQLPAQHDRAGVCLCQRLDARHRPPLGQIRRGDSSSSGIAHSERYQPHRPAAVCH